MSVEVRRILRIRGRGPLKARVDVMLFRSVIIKGCLVMAGQKGSETVRVPRKQGVDGKWHPVIEFPSAGFKAEFHSKVLKAYKNKRRAKCRKRKKW